jgi:hypothetical protein
MFFELFLRNTAQLLTHHARIVRSVAHGKVWYEAYFRTPKILLKPDFNNRLSKKQRTSI